MRQALSAAEALACQLINRVLRDSLAYDNVRQQRVELLKLCTRSGVVSSPSPMQWSTAGCAELTVADLVS